MEKLTSFKISKLGNKSQLQVYAIEQANTKNRSYRSISKLLGSYKIKTDLDFWDDSNQQFKTEVKKGICIPTAKEDNEHISMLLNKLEEFSQNESCTYSNVFDLYLAQTDSTTPKNKIPSVLEYSIQYAEMWKQNKVKGYLHKSNNYRIYEKMYHKLQGLSKGKKQLWAEGIKRFANQPIDKVTSKDYNSFIKYLSDNKIAIKDTYIAYRATIYHYHHVLLNNPSYTLELDNKSKELTQKDTQKKSITEALSLKQIKQLIECDTDKINMGSNVNNELKELYKDCCLLMYYLYTRPCDLVSMRIEDLIIDHTNKEYYWRYVATKMKNTTGEVLDTPIKDEALEIILKYKGDRTSGLLLPLPCNKLEDTKIETWKIRWNKETCRIGKFLQAVSTYYKWNLRKNPTMYTLRTSTFNHAINRNIPLETIASVGHTSSREILKTYTDRNHLARSINRNSL